MNRIVENLRVAMLGTTDGDFIDPNSEIPAGEMFRLAAEYVDSLLTTEWSDSVPNDGEYEYTGTSWCDGSHVTRLRRLPRLTLTVEPTTWETTTEDAIAKARYTDGTPAIPTPSDAGSDS